MSSPLTLSLSWFTSWLSVTHEVFWGCNSKIFFLYEALSSSIILAILILQIYCQLPADILIDFFLLQLKCLLHILLDIDEEGINMFVCTVFDGFFLWEGCEEDKYSYFLFRKIFLAFLDYWNIFEIFCFIFWKIKRKEFRPNKNWWIIQNFILFLFFKKIK